MTGGAGAGGGRRRPGEGLAEGLAAAAAGAAWLLARRRRSAARSGQDALNFIIRVCAVLQVCTSVHFVAAKLPTRSRELEDSAAMHQFDHAGRQAPVYLWPLFNAGCTCTNGAPGGTFVPYGDRYKRYNGTWSH